MLRRPIESAQYTSLAYGTYAKTSGIALSMGSVGDPWDNAVAETFFASLEKELHRRERFPTREAARMRLFWYIECFYNTRRRHSGLGYLSPADYEERHTNPSGPFGPADPVQPAEMDALVKLGPFAHGRLPGARRPARGQRQLVTLRSAGRNRMPVPGRELWPRPFVASRCRKAGIEDPPALPRRSPRPR